MKDLAEERLHDPVIVPDLFQEIEHLEPIQEGGVIRFYPKKGREHRPLNVGVVLSGGQAAGGHNVILGVFEALQKLHPESKVFGFLGGPSGILEKKYRELTQPFLNSFRNAGGFDMIGSGRTKIETVEQMELAAQTCRELFLDGLVIIGGDDSNTNAALLAEYFQDKKCPTHVVGVPKTIDGDLKNAHVETSFGFDTACKIYSEMIGNLCRDALSAKKYTHFIRLMGRSASHIALECALQTHPNLTLIGEEIAALNRTLADVTASICDCIQKRGEEGKHYAVFLLPEGLIEFIPEMKTLIRELNTLLAQDEHKPLEKLSESSKKAFALLPKEIQEQMLLDRDPHGNVQVSHIATEQLLIHTVKNELKKRGLEKKFSPVGHFFGYEGRCGFPSNFDATYCYSLGLTAALLLVHGLTGYMSVVQNLVEPTEKWYPAGIPLKSLMVVEERKGKQKRVIQKALVDLEGEPFQYFASKREDWSFQDSYRFPGPIQFYGDPEVCNATTLTLQIERKHKECPLN